MIRDVAKLQMNDLRICNVEFEKGVISIFAKPKEKQIFCPCCGEKLIFKANSKHSIKDSDLADDLPVYLILTLTRGYCKKCHKGYIQKCAESPIIFEYNGKKVTHNLTKRHAYEIIDLAFMVNPNYAAEKYNIKTSTVQRLLKDYIESTELSLELTEKIGVDQIYLGNSTYTVFTNCDNGKVLDIIDGSDKTTLERYFNCRNKMNVRYAVVDFDNSYVSTLKKCLCDSRIILDKFHVVKKFNDALTDEINGIIRTNNNFEERVEISYFRNLILKKVENLTQSQLDDLKIFETRFAKIFELKKAFDAIYSSIDEKEATKNLEYFITIAQQFGGIIGSLGNLFEKNAEYILGYFYCKITNAYAEANNRMIRGIWYLTYNSSFEYLRAKVLYKNRRDH